MYTTTINTALKSLLVKKAEKMARCAAKLGMAVPIVTFGAVEEQIVGSDTIAAYKCEDGKYRALYTEVFIEGDAPVISGHRFVATVDLMGEKPMVRVQPHLDAAVDLSRFHNTDGHCDHCHTNRARNDVLVIQNVETGELMQLGRNCANDFFGTTDAAARISCSDWIEAYGNVTDPQGRHESTVPLHRIYEVAAACVRTWGWVHHKDLWSDNTLISTKARVWSNLFPSAHMKKEDRVIVTADDTTESEIVMQWLTDKFLSKDSVQCSDFERNVQAAVEGQDSVPYVRAANLNYLIWGIAGYKRDLQRDAEKRRQAAELAKQVNTSDHTGTVGARLDMVLTLEFKRAFGSDYGVRYMQKFRDANDNVIVWWGTNDVAACTVIGNTYTFKATIKGHDEYNGVNQTTITRATLIEGVLAELEDV